MNKMGKSLVVSSVKGGVGKTVTVLNLAGICELLGKKTLIIDFDIYTGNIALTLNTKFISSMYNLTQDIANNNYQKLENYVVKYDNFIDILPAPKDPRASLKINLAYIETIVDLARSNYDIVLIDTTHILNELNIRLFDKTDSLLLLMENDPQDVRNMKALLKVLNNSKNKKYQIMLNNSTNPYKNYFSTYDLETIIDHKIKYRISNHFFIKNIDDFIMNGEIVTLNKRMSNLFNKEFSQYTDVIASLFSDKDGDK